jgi:hypothetical protein
MPLPVRFSRPHRYSRSRMRLLLRPRVWLSAAVPALALALAWAYWQRPALLTDLGGDRPLESLRPDQPRDIASPSGLLELERANSGQSMGDRAQIDIDNLPVLGARRFPSGTPLTLEEPLVSPDSIPDALKSPRQSDLDANLPGSAAIAPTDLSLLNPAPSITRSTPDEAKPDSILNTVTVSPTANPVLPSPAIAGLGTVSSPVPGSTVAQPSIPANPLESALQRQTVSISPRAATDPPAAAPSGALLRSPGAVPSSAVLQPIPGEPAQPLSQPVVTPAFSTPTLPGPYLPRTSPPPGTTGYLPPLGVQPLSAGSSSQPITTAPAAVSPALPVPDAAGSDVMGLPGSSSAEPTRPQFDGRDLYTAPAQPALPAAEAAPFSAPPRPRNGEFNTFSNP